MKFVIIFVFCACISSCWKPYHSYSGYTQNFGQKVWGNRPIYSAKNTAQVILYDPHKHNILSAGNIYAFGNFIFLFSHFISSNNESVRIYEYVNL